MQNCLEDELGPGVGSTQWCSTFLQSRALGSFAHWSFFSSQNEKGMGHLTPQLAGQQTHFLLSGEMCGILQTVPEYI